MAESFSLRMGHIAPKAIQISSIDDDLKNLLWEECYTFLGEALNQARKNGGVQTVCRLIWVEFFKLSYDSFEALAAAEARPLSADARHRSQAILKQSREFFLGKYSKWNKLFDFIEFILHMHMVPDDVKEESITNMNERLVQEKSAYRIVNRLFVPITNQAELSTVQTASKPAATAIAPVAVHVQQALNLLADRTAPDYRNSIKESISAVESLCKFVAGLPSTTLGPALDKVAKELDLNDHIRDSVKSLYKYTSDAHGIRHGLKDHEHPEQVDALFMLVTCSAFVNFVTEKARQQGKLPT